MNKIDTKFDKIMIVDDNNIDIYIANKIITNNNFAKDIITYNCALEAFKFISSTNDKKLLPEIIFLDLNFNGISGFDFLELYETLPNNKKNEIIIYIVSSTVDSRDLEKINQNKNVKGFCEKYISKEFLDSI